MYEGSTFSESEADLQRIRVFFGCEVENVHSRVAIRELFISLLESPALTLRQLLGYVPK